MDTEERNRRDEDEDEPPAKAGVLRARLELVGHYALLGLAPVMSAVALVFALLAYTGNQSNRAQLSETNARIDSIGASHSDSKGETDIFQVSLAREKALLAEERKKQVDKDAKIISSVTQLQNKLKVSPTLDEQIKEAAKASETAISAASAPVAAAPVTGTPPAPAPTPAAVPAPAVVEKAQPAQPPAKPAATANAPAPAKVEKVTPAQPSPKPAAAAKVTAPAAKDIAKKPAPVPPAKSTKADALKKTLEEFNKIDRGR